jgi:hypothetical protein
MLQCSNIPKATLKKSQVNIVYHICHEKVADNILIPIKKYTTDNIRDTTTKTLEGSALKHMNKVLFNKPFHKELEINLHRMKISFDVIDRS